MGRGTNIFSQFARGVWESSAGRINWFPNMWAKIESRWDKKRIQNKALAGTRPWCNEAGELVRDGAVLVTRNCVSTCPNPPSEDFYRDPERANRAWEPATECRKCEYHRKADGRFRFPRCVFNRTEDPSKIADNAAAVVLDTINTARTKARDITK